MQHEQIEFLQDKLVQEAAAMIVLAGPEAKVEEYEQAIKLVGKAWDSEQSEVDKWLDIKQRPLGRFTTFCKGCGHTANPRSIKREGTVEHNCTELLQL